MKLSIIIPVYNEVDTIEKIINKIRQVKLDKKIYIVDDFSIDGTRDVIKNLESEEITVTYHSENLGKGAAIKTALLHIKEDIIIIQDADLEYSPEEYPNLIKPILDGRVDVVYGSRFINTRNNFSILQFWANKFLTFLTNFLYKANLSDMETGYKVFKKEILDGITIKSNKFDFEAEITAKMLKKKARIAEVPIIYKSRRYSEGKKIMWKDGFVAIWALFKYRFKD